MGMKPRCKLCGWCRFSRWGFYRGGLKCEVVERAGDPVRAYGESCNYYEREPGADDNRGEVTEDFELGEFAL